MPPKCPRPNIYGLSSKCCSREKAPADLSRSALCISPVLPHKRLKKPTLKGRDLRILITFTTAFLSKTDLFVTWGVWCWMVRTSHWGRSLAGLEPSGPTPAPSSHLTLSSVKRQMTSPAPERVFRDTRRTTVLVQIISGFRPWLEPEI